MSSIPDKDHRHALAIFGASDMILGYRALGIQAYLVSTSSEFREALTTAIGEGASVCLVQEEIYSISAEAIAPYQSQPVPVFIPFSGTGKNDLLDQMIKAIRLKATGVY